MAKKDIAYQEFVFKQPLAPYETKQLRSAVLQLIDGHPQYHNHINDNYWYHYPLIQYRSLFGSAAILYLGEAIENISELFGTLPKSVVVRGKPFSFKIEKLNARLYTLQVSNSFYYYDIINWIPLQNEKYGAYKQLSTETERITFLKNILVTNILTFAKGVGWLIDEAVVIDDFEIVKQKWVSFKQNKFLSFNVRFSANVFLPPHIGLGKGAAHNYGVVYPVKRKQSVLFEKPFIA